MKLLLEREEVNPGKLNNDCRTQLSYAAEGGYSGVVKLLLEREVVNPDELDKRSESLSGYADMVGGRTPFSYAAGCGYEAVLKLLPKQEDANPEKPDKGGRTPLSYAALGGHEEVVKLLSYSNGKRSIPTSLIVTAKHRSYLLPCIAVIKLQPYYSPVER